MNASTGKLQDENYGRSAAILPDGILIVITRGSSSLGIWDLLSRISSKYKISVDCEADTAHFISLNGKYAIHIKNTTMWAWDMKTKCIARTFPPQDDSYILDTIFSSDGSRFLTKARSGLASVWDANSWSPTELHTLSAPEGYELDFGWSDYSLDAGLVAVPLKRETWSIGTWNLSTGQRSQTIDCKRQPYYIVISPDGRQIAANLQSPFDNLI